MFSKFLFCSLLLYPCLNFSQQGASPVGNLPPEVPENSGLVFFNRHLITHNDSGDLPRLYEIDTTSLQLRRVISITNAEHVDWEDMTQDDQYIYIGDIGNNQGDRDELIVYRINKSDYDLSDEVVAEQIRFSYEDQPDFEEGPEPNWDAEALAVFEDSLLIFTKQPQDGNTQVYSVPKSPGDHVAKKLDAFAANGLITGATFNPATRTLYLSGYSSQLLPFLVRVPDLQEVFSFTPGTERIEISVGFAQVEGITYSAPDRYFFSSERFAGGSPEILLEAQLFSFSTADNHTDETPLDDPAPEEGPEEDLEVHDLVLYKERGTDVLQYSLPPNSLVFGRAIFDNTGRLVRYTHAKDIDSNTVGLSGLDGTIFYLAVYLQNGILSKPFILD